MAQGIKKGRFKMKLSNPFLKIQKLNFEQRWVLYGILVLIAIAFFYFSIIQRSSILGAFLLIYMIAAIAIPLVGGGTAIVTGTVGIAVGLIFFNVFDVQQSIFSWILVIGLLLNILFWNYLRQNAEIENFNYQKIFEELEVKINSMHAELEKNQQAFQSNQIKIHRYRALNELARNLAMTSRTTDVINLLIETVAKTFMVPGGVYALILFDSSLGKSLHSIRYGVDTDLEIRLNRDRIDPDEVFNRWILNQSKPLFVSDLSNDFRFQAAVGEKKFIGSLISVPFLAGNEILGLLRIESSSPKVFRQDDARLLSNFADLGTVTLEYAALYRQTIDLAITDGLTGLFVQRYYKERIRDEVLRTIERKYPVSLMMIDVDNFKNYNDQYGHLIGDRVLKAIADVLKKAVRTVDVVARYGGEEFSILLPKTDWEGTRHVAERIRQKVADLEIWVGNDRTGVTVSIGVAEWGPSMHDAEALIQLADQGLYQAKASGKNCVILAKGPQNV
jgi:diguanylate cyclase (GGDEF)-like protein